MSWLIGFVIVVLWVCFVVIAAIIRAVTGSSTQRPPGLTGAAMPSSGAYDRAGSSVPSVRTAHSSAPAPAVPARAGVQQPSRTADVAPEAQPTADDCWVPPGGMAEVAGRWISGGMIYVGSGLTAVGGSRTPEPALINPRLPIGRVPDIAGHTMSYWPSYSSITPEARAAYLNWLASGRNDPSAYIGYVFLFFYGLERRLLADSQYSPRARGEYPTLIAEIQRLLELHGESGSFHQYATSLLSVAQIIHGGQDPTELTPPLERVGYDLPISVKWGLAKFIEAGRPIPADWALSWYVNQPEARLRTPATRCSKEFRALFAGRYVAKYGEGMMVKPTKTPLKIAYRPASLSFGRELSVGSRNLCDVSRLKRPLRAIEELVEECTTALDPYSRCLGRRESQTADLAALALLPRDLLERHRGREITAFREWLTEVVPSGKPAVLQADDLTQRFSVADPAKLAKKEAVALAQLLEHCGYGIEPDVRFGGAPLKAGNPVTLFRLPQGAPSAPSVAYAVASLIVRLFWAVASADGDVGRREQGILSNYMERHLGLSAAEKARLAAHVRWLVHARPGTAGMQKRMDVLPEEQRILIGRFLVRVAWADGILTPSEVSALTRAYQLLGLPEDDVHREIHQLGAPTGAAGEPVTIVPATPGAPGVPVPAPSTREGPSPLDLDMEALQRKLAETAHVSAVLSAVFDDEDAAECPAAQEETGPCVAGLDAAHSALLRDLGDTIHIGRAEFEELAERHHLLPDGALDTLNEAALELCDELLCEGDDALVINESVSKEMLA